MNGVYALSFKSSRDSNTGTAVFIDNKVYGGDTAYYYKGSAEIGGENVSCDVQVVRHSPGVSIFGPLNNFELEMTGTISDNGNFKLSGNVVSQPALKISIDGRKVSDL